MTSIDGFSNYLIYENGDVYSKYCKRILFPIVTPFGYHKIKLNNDCGLRKTMFIHRLVALAYIPNPDNKKEVDHIDQDKTNNQKDNLRWATRSENMLNIKQARCDNIFNEKCISIKHDRKYTYYHFQKQINGVRHQKKFKTLEEAIKYRDDFLKNNNN